jgi:hypothetical protein
MSISVNPVNSIYYPTGIAANAANNTNAIAAYEQLLALQAEDDLLFEDDNSTSSASTVDDSALLSADLLNLSPAALNILNGIDNASATAGTTSTLTLTGTLGQAGLTPSQQTQIAAIVAQYANQPLTQTTFTQIENALTAAGINPELVSIQQLLEAYSYAYAPGLAFDGQLFTDTLASELDNA